MPVKTSNRFTRQQWLACSFFALVSISVMAEDAAQAHAESAEEMLKKVSYGIGLNIASNFKKQNITLDKTYFNKGMEDGEHGNRPMYDQAAVMAAMQAFQSSLIQNQGVNQQAMSARNKAAADAFLAANAQKEGVITTASGLQYRIISRGSGSRNPALEDTVVVHYVGKLMNGTEFDSSYSRNEPAIFGVGDVIPGWTEALKLMAVGDRFQLFIPAHLAYGEGGAGKKIEPNALIIFEVELLEIR